MPRKTLVQIWKLKSENPYFMIHLASKLCLYLWLDLDTKKWKGDLNRLRMAQEAIVQIADKIYEN